MSIPNLKKIQPYAYFLYKMHMAEYEISKIISIYLLPLPELL